MKQLILIRHASRMRTPSSADDRDLPLSPDGENEARGLGVNMASRGLKPALYLTSRYNHAEQTGKLLSREIEGHPPAAVVVVSTLTPVLHHPRIDQLLARLTGQEPHLTPAYAEAICLTANAPSDFLEGKAYEDFRIQAAPQ